MIKNHFGFMPGRSTIKVIYLLLKIDGSLLREEEKFIDGVH